MTNSVTHAFTVDVEDWFHILDCPQMPSLAQYDGLESRVERNTDLVLDALARHGVHGTFFVLGWVAHTHPHVVRKIVAGGHEIAVHGYAHVLASDLTDAELEADTRRACDAVGAAAGVAPVGYRSPGGSLLARQRWLFDLLLDLGIRFDSSIYPRPGGLAEAEGFPTRPYAIHRRGERTLWEYPSTIRPWLGQQWAFAEGGYLRLLPLSLVRRWFGEHERAAQCVNLCIHPREFDPAQPRLPLAPFKQWKAQVGLAGLAGKVDALLAGHRFGRMGDILGL
jgi:peptidoglycan-N-acetylglucosamine deacetylase